MTCCGTFSPNNRFNVNVWAFLDFRTSMPNTPPHYGSELAKNRQNLIHLHTIVRNLWFFACILSSCVRIFWQWFFFNFFIKKNELFSQFFLFEKKKTIKSSNFNNRETSLPSKSCTLCHSLIISFLQSYIVFSFRV